MLLFCSFRRFPQHVDVANIAMLYNQNVPSKKSCACHNRFSDTHNLWIRPLRFLEWNTGEAIAVIRPLPVLYLRPHAGGDVKQFRFINRCEGWLLICRLAPPSWPLILLVLILVRLAGPFALILL